MLCFFRAIGGGETRSELWIGILFMYTSFLSIRNIEPSCFNQQKTSNAAKNLKGHCLSDILSTNLLHSINLKLLKAFLIIE